MRTAYCLLSLAMLVVLGVPVRGDEAAIRKEFDAYIDAFNKQDVPGIRAMWAEKAVYTDRATGERVEGGKAIADDIVAGFKTSPATRIAGQIDRVRMIKPDVASVEGATTLSSPESEPVLSAFSAILIAVEGKWQIDSIEENTLAAATSSSAALNELQWLVGEWADESESGRVKTTFRWSANQAFLLRSFVVHGKDEIEQEGTQIIGWDPRAQQIRSWSFISDGSFGDGTWSKNGNEWLIKSSQTLSSGEAASGTYVLSRVDDNTMSLQLIGHEVEGAPQPAAPAVTIVRVTETAPVITPQSEQR